MLRRTSTFHSLSLANNGANDIDAAFYAWAVTTLNERTDLNKASEEFAVIAACYNDKTRFFHRGLGHSRSLFPAAAQTVYKEILGTPENRAYLASIIPSRLHSLIPGKENKIREAQEILAAYYHDIIHRNGDKPALLDKYVRYRDGYFLADATLTPVTASLLNQADVSLKVEELSCIMAEHAFKRLEIPVPRFIPVLLAIMATIPFSIYSQPDNLRQRLHKTLETLGITYNADAMDSALMVALMVSNRDLGSYGEDKFNEFNMKTWAMMMERTPALASADHTLFDEIETIERFYKLHKRLHAEVSAGKTRLYESLDLHEARIAELNKNAEKTLQLDVTLQGILLGTAVIMTYIINKHNSVFGLDLPIRVAANNANLKSYIDTFRYNRMETDTALPQEVTAVLNEHGTTCTVNGNLIVRGSEVSSYALQLINVFGHEELLNIADAFCNCSSTNSTWFRTNECESAIQQLFNKRKNEIHNSLKFNETQKQILNEIMRSIDEDVADQGQHAKQAKIYQAMITPELDKKRMSQLGRWRILDSVMTIRSIVIHHDKRQGDVSFILKNNNGNNATVADIALYVTEEINGKLRKILGSSWIATEKTCFIDMSQHRSSRHALEMEDFFGIDFEEVGMEKPFVDFMALQHELDFKSAKEKIAASVKFNTTYSNIQRKLFKAVRTDWEYKNQGKINSLIDKVSKDLVKDEVESAAWDSIPAYTERRVDPKPIVDAANAKQDNFEKREAELMDRLHTAVVNKNRKEAKEIRSHFDMPRSIFHDLKKKWRHDHKHESRKERSNKMK